MPNCKAMIELKDGERIAGKLMNSSRPDDVKAMYADWALTSKKAQTLHWEHCEECQSCSNPT